MITCVKGRCKLNSTSSRESLQEGNIIFLVINMSVHTLKSNAWTFFNPNSEGALLCYIKADATFLQLDIFIPKIND